VSGDPRAGFFPGQAQGEAEPERLLGRLAGRLLVPFHRRPLNRVHVLFDPADPASLAFLGGMCPALLDGSGLEQLWAPVGLRPGSAAAGEAFLKGRRGAPGEPGGKGAGESPAGGPARAAWLDFLDREAGDPEAPARLAGSPALMNAVILTRLAGRMEGRGMPALLWLEEGFLKCLFGVVRAGTLGERVPGMLRGRAPRPGGRGPRPWAAVTRGARARAAWPQAISAPAGRARAPAAGPS
jgi:hypothetical protein